MIFRHIIFLNFKDSVSDAQIKNIFFLIGELQVKISGIMSYSWGKNNNLEFGNKYTYGFVMDFDSRLSRENYQTHPEHIKMVKEYVNPYYAEAIVFDYEII